LNFYQELSPLYDDMINFSHRLDREKVIFEDILKNYPAQTALDAGCGSGFHTILLSQLNLDVTGIDNSESMLKLARKNSQKYSLSPSFINSNFLSLNEQLNDNYDAVFCLGNSFVHLLTEEDQVKSLINFRSILKKKGYLCLQIVNYDKILKNKQNVLAVREVNDQKITRLYSFKENTVIFTVKVETEEDCKEISTELYPMKSDEIQLCLQKAGFGEINLYGDLKLNSYERFESDNICLICYADR
jgi:ubiquinone/menaquinone biosynthesis C-methylase UbiE